MRSTTARSRRGVRLVAGTVAVLAVGLVGTTAAPAHAAPEPGQEWKVLYQAQPTEADLDDTDLDGLRVQVCGSVEPENPWRVAITADAIPTDQQPQDQSDAFCDSFRVPNPPGDRAVRIRFDDTDPGPEEVAVVDVVNPGHLVLAMCAKQQQQQQRTWDVRLAAKWSSQDDRSTEGDCKHDSIDLNRIF